MSLSFPVLRLPLFSPVVCLCGHVGVSQLPLVPAEFSSISNTDAARLPDDYLPKTFCSSLGFGKVNLDHLGNGLSNFANLATLYRSINSKESFKQTQTRNIIPWTEEFYQIATSFTDAAGFCGVQSCNQRSVLKFGRISLEKRHMLPSHDFSSQ